MAVRVFHAPRAHIFVLCSLTQGVRRVEMVRFSAYRTGDLKTHLTRTYAATWLTFSFFNCSNVLHYAQARSVKQIQLSSGFFLSSEPQREVRIGRMVFPPRCWSVGTKATATFSRNVLYHAQVGSVKQIQPASVFLLSSEPASADSARFVFYAERSVRVRMNRFPDVNCNVH